MWIAYIVTSSLSAVSLAIVAQSAGPLSREIRIPAHTNSEYSTYCSAAAATVYLSVVGRPGAEGVSGGTGCGYATPLPPTINILHNTTTDAHNTHGCCCAGYSGDRLDPLQIKANRMTRPKQIPPLVMMVFGPKLLMAKSLYPHYSLPHLRWLVIR